MQNQHVSYRQAKLPLKVNTSSLTSVSKLVDEFRLKITIHSVQINIPQSIKMVVQSSYKAQSQETQAKCRLSKIKALGDKQVNELKIADFQNQELFLNVTVDSQIDYLEEHINKLDSLPQHDQDQKCSLKLLAVSDNKTKLIGLVHYTFVPKTSQFKPLDRQTIKFIKSIDPSASICVSTELQKVKVYT